MIAADYSITLWLDGSSLVHFVHVGVNALTVYGFVSDVLIC